MARGPTRSAANGCKEWRLVRRLLLGVDGVVLRAWRHEHRLDGGDRRPDRNREDAPLEARCDMGSDAGPARARPSAACRSACRPGAHDTVERFDATDDPYGPLAKRRRARNAGPSSQSLLRVTEWLRPRPVSS